MAARGLVQALHQIKSRSQAPGFQMEGLGEALTWDCAVLGKAEIKALHLTQGLKDELEQRGINYRELFDFSRR